MDRVLPVSEQQNRRYKYFQAEAYAPGRVTPLSEKTPFLINEELLFQEYCKTGLADKKYIEELASMRGVKPTRRNMQISLDKCDTKPIFVEDDIQAYVDELVYQYLSPYLTVPYCNSDHKYEINLSSSPGKFWKRQGCKTKGDALKHPKFSEYLTSIDHIPICDYNGKIELLDSDLIRDGKIRGTFNPPLDFIMKQKYLYDLQNKALLENHDEIWIKYGFVKQYGGVDRMGKILELCQILSCDDCIGYDRIAFLKKVYELRNRCLQFPSHLKDLVDYVTYYTIHSYIACPDGVIRQRATGNISGSNNTTTDNSILHTFIQFRFIVNLWLKYLNRYPTLQEVVDAAKCYIFSDDNTCGYKFPFNISLDEFYEEKVRTYRMFGFELKPAQKELSRPSKGNLGNHSFLGSSFHYDEEYQMYVPYPRVEKIASSLIYCVDSHEPVDVLAKAYALTVLSCMVPKLGDECRKFLKFLLSNVKNPQKVLGYDGVNLINMAIDNPKIFYLQHMGRQASFLMEVGRNKKMAEASVSNDIPKIEKKIDTLVAKVGGSEEGSLWVKETMDPFNDEPRRHVGFPDLIIGNSIVQCVKQSIQYQIGATAQDVHIFMDTLDTSTLVYENTNFAEASLGRPNCYVVDAVGGVAARSVGGLCIRTANVGTPLTLATQVNPSNGIPRNYLNNGPVRVLSKGFEVHNTTPMLQVGGSVCVYRDTGAVPYESQTTCTLMNNTTNTTNSAYEHRTLSRIPESLQECIIIPGAQQWEAKDGCYNVCVMSAQTNEPREEQYCVVKRTDSSSAVGKSYINSFIQGTFPTIKDTGVSSAAQPHLFSPFFLSGAYFTGLPANSTLTIDYIWIIERFPTPDSELVTLASPSPAYDPVALELYSKSAAKLPHGMKVKNNADGDWIKNIADVLSNFGVPGMPLVKGAVDLWNGFNSKDDPASKVGRITNAPQFSNFSRPKKPQRIRQPPQQQKIVYVQPPMYNRPLPPPPLPPRDYVVRRVIKVNKRNRKVIKK